MATATQVLFILPRQEEVATLTAELEKANYLVEGFQARTEAEWEAATRKHWELILADADPKVSGWPAVRRRYRKRGLNIPLVLISDPGTEHAELACLRRGADGYLCRDRLSELGSEVYKAMTCPRDRTARARVESDLATLAKQIKDLGRFGDGMAHDFNNLLAVIAGYGELLRDEQPAGGQARGMLNEILEASERATRLSRQLLTLCRRAMFTPEALKAKEARRE